LIKPSFKEFSKLSKRGNVIPVFKEINADLDTPVSAFLKIRKGDYSFLLESVEGQEKIARYSFLGTNPRLIIKSKGKRIEILDKEGKVKKSFFTEKTPLDEIKKIMLQFHGVEVSGLPRFYGGVVGYIGYDTVRFFENIPDKNKDDLKIPDILFMLTDTLLIFDRLNQTIKILNNVFLPKEANNRKKLKLYKEAVKKIESIFHDFSRSVITKETPSKTEKTNIKVNLTQSEFIKIVEKAKKYIKRGDIIQVVPSQRFEIKTKKEDFTIYRSLRQLNPSPYMYYLKLKDFSIIGSSPEMLVRCENGLVQTRPIAGTRRRGQNANEDLLLEEELLKDEKEKAEHLMLVDLGRNDLGKISRVGKVKVDEFMRVEKFSHVMHLVSQVSAILDKNRFDIYDVVKATFPAGTVSGSPKIRAMEIIDELENVKRALYAGSIGYFSFTRNMDTCIAIRTILLKNGSAYIQVGAGIVADSVPKKEYQETINKAKALIEALRK